MTRGSSFKWVVLFLMVFGTAMLNYSNFAFSARSLDVMAQFNMSQAQLTAISGIGVLPGALFSVLLGSLFDKRGAAFMRFAGGALLLLAAACQIWRVVASSYAELFVITFLSGCFFLPTQVLPAKLVGAWFERREMGMAMGVYGAAAGIGITCAFATANLFSTVTAMLAFCAAGFIATTVLWLFAARLPKAEQAKDSREEHPIDSHYERGLPERCGGSAVSVGAVLKSKNMWLIMVCGGLAACAPMLYNSYVINVFVERGMDFTLAGFIGVVFNACLVVGAIMAGFVVSKTGRYNRVYTLFSLVAGAALLVSYFAPAGILTFVLAGVAALFGACTLSVNLARIPLIPLTGDFSHECIGIAGGLHNTAMGLCGFALPTIVAAMLGDNYLGVFVVVFALFAVMALCGGILLPELGEEGELARRAQVE